MTCAKPAWPITVMKGCRAEGATAMLTSQEYPDKGTALALLSDTAAPGIAAEGH